MHKVKSEPKYIIIELSWPEKWLAKESGEKSIS